MSCPSETTVLLTLYAKVMDTRSFSSGGSFDLLSFMIYGFSLKIYNSHYVSGVGLLMYRWCLFLNPGRAFDGI